MRLPKLLLACSFVLAMWSETPAFADPDKEQLAYEKEISAVVRNKRYYKEGRLELGVFAGFFPYDSVFSSYPFGGKLIWHLSDHFAWEIINASVIAGSRTSFTNSLVLTATTITNVQAPQLQKMISSSFYMSPFYGKLHFSGRYDQYFDLFVLFGFAAGEVKTVRFANVASAVTETTVRTAWDLGIHGGLGFKFFFLEAMSLSIELRDTVLYTEVYGKKRLRSFYSAIVGLNAMF